MIEPMAVVGGPRDGKVYRVRLPEDSKPLHLKIEGVTYLVAQAQVGIGRVLVDEAALRLYENPPV